MPAPSFSLAVIEFARLTNISAEAASSATPAVAPTPVATRTAPMAAITAAPMASKTSERISKISPDSFFACASSSLRLLSSILAWFSRIETRFVSISLLARLSITLPSASFSFEVISASITSKSPEVSLGVMVRSALITLSNSGVPLVGTGPDPAIDPAPVAPVWSTPPVWLVWAIPPVSGSRRSPTPLIPSSPLSEVPACSAPRPA